MPLPWFGFKGGFGVRLDPFWGREVLSAAAGAGHGAEDAADEFAADLGAEGAGGAFEEAVPHGGSLPGGGARLAGIGFGGCGGGGGSFGAFFEEFVGGFAIDGFAVDGGGG